MLDCSTENNVEVEKNELKNEIHNMKLDIHSLKIRATVTRQKKKSQYGHQGLSLPFLSTLFSWQKHALSVFIMRSFSLQW